MSSILTLVIYFSSIFNNHPGSGTFIGSLTTNSGIIVCHDTRTTFVDDEGTALFTIDNVAKSIKLGNNIVVVGGLTHINDTSIIYYLLQVDDPYVPPHRLILKINELFTRKFPKEKFGRNYEETYFFISGYNESIPEYWAFNLNRRFWGPENKWLFSREYLKSKKDYLMSMDYISASETLKKDFHKISKDHLDVGGPTVIWYINEHTKVPVCLSGCDGTLNIISLQDAMIAYEIFPFLNPRRKKD